jgi:hypothetical protein
MTPQSAGGYPLGQFRAGGVITSWITEQYGAFTLSPIERRQVGGKPLEPSPLAGVREGSLMRS